MRFLKPSEVVFAEDKLEKEFNDLKDDSEIRKYIQGQY